MPREYKTRVGRDRRVPTLVELPIDLRSALDDYSEKTEVPMTRIIRKAIRLYLEGQGVEFND